MKNFEELLTTPMSEVRDSLRHSATIQHAGVQMIEPRIDTLRRELTELKSSFYSAKQEFSRAKYNKSKDLRKRESAFFTARNLYNQFITKLSVKEKALLAYDPKLLTKKELAEPAANYLGMLED